MPFTDQEYFEVIEKNEIVKKAFENIKQICIDLQKQTNCPEAVSYTHLTLPTNREV